MIYTHEDNHKIIKAIKKKGWVLFEVYANRVTEANGIHGGWWVDCAVAYNTEHYESHKKINHIYLGNTLKDSMLFVKEELPTNN